MCFRSFQAPARDVRRISWFCCHRRITCRSAAQSDPLPSWNDGAAKKAITDFVARVTTQGGADFVPAEQRIATFDNDGTLWTEQPVYFQLAFAFDRVKAMAPQHPEWKTKQPFKALLDKDMKAWRAAGEKGLLKIVAATHTGMTTEVRQGRCGTGSRPRGIRASSGPITTRLSADAGAARLSARQRLQDLIVSGGGIEFMRPWVEKVYGIPPEQVVGSSGVVKFGSDADGKPELVKIAKVEFIDDGPASRSASIVSSGGGRSSRSAIPTAICRCCSGRRRAGPRFAGIVHHTDAAREFAYDRKSRIGKLDKALDEAQEMAGRRHEARLEEGLRVRALEQLVEA